MLKEVCIITGDVPWLVVVVVVVLKLCHPRLWCRRNHKRAGVVELGLDLEVQRLLDKDLLAIHDGGYVMMEGSMVCMYYEGHKRKLMMEKRKKIIISTEESEEVLYTKCDYVTSV